MHPRTTQQKILIEAEDLIQRFGFFGLSLQDLADRIQIRKPSLYAHYESKEDLGVSIIRDYERRFRKWMERLKLESPDVKLQEFYKLLEGYLNAGKVCPNSSLSLEGARLPEAMKTAYLAFLETQVSWIAEMIREGQERQFFFSTRDAREIANLAFQRMIGAQLMSRMTGDSSWFYSGSEDVIRLIRGEFSSPSALVRTLSN